MNYSFLPHYPDNTPSPHLAFDVDKIYPVFGFWQQRPLRVEASPKGWESLTGFYRQKY